MQKCSLTERCDSRSPTRLQMALAHRLQGKRYLHGGTACCVWPGAVNSLPCIELKTAIQEQRSYKAHDTAFLSAFAAMLHDMQRAGAVMAEAQ